MSDLPDDRPTATGLIATFLRRYQSPRSQVVLLLMLAGAVGAGASFLLLRAGLTSMPARYPVSALLSYATFLVLLTQWAQYQAGRPELAAELERHASRARERTEGPVASERAGRDTSGWTWVDLFDFVPDLGDVGAFVLVIGAVALVAALAAIVMMAPVILSEVLLDALLMAGLWRRFTRHGATESVSGALRATYLPAAAVIVGLAALGFGLEILVPGAHSLGDLFRLRGQ